MIYRLNYTYTITNKGLTANILFTNTGLTANTLPKNEVVKNSKQIEYSIIFRPDLLLTKLSLRTNLEVLGNDGRYQSWQLPNGN